MKVIYAAGLGGLSGCLGRLRQLVGLLDESKRPFLFSKRLGLIMAVADHLAPWPVLGGETEHD